MAQKRFSYSAEFKLKVIQFAKVNGNRAAERKFGPPPTEKTIRDWLWEEETLLKTRQKKAMRGMKDSDSSSDTDEDKLMVGSFDSDEELYEFYDE